MSESSAPPSKMTKSRRAVAVVVIVALVSVSSFVAYLQWVNSNLIFCYGGCGVRLGIVSVNLQQVGIATFNITNVQNNDITITQASVSWVNSTPVNVLVNSGNVVPAHRFLVLLVNFNFRWQSGVSYQFTLFTDKGFPAFISGQL